MAGEPGPAEGEQPLEGTEVLAMRIEFDLVPEWSNVVERIAKHHGERTAIGVEGGVLVVKVAVQPDRKDALLGDMKRYWDAFVDRRKREGRWRA